jgi:FtsP/CotA-like multicopper oxidase with cupredoxin domain
LIVDNKPEVYSYDGEFSLALSDWYHQTAEENEKWYLSPLSGGIPPHPDSIMINGKGRYPCRTAALLGRPCSPFAQVRPLFNLQHFKSYRVRVINTSSRTSFNFSIDGHSLQAIEVDGVDVDESQSVRALANVAFISPGQRYSFLLKKNSYSFPIGLQRHTIRATASGLVLGSGTSNINPRPDAMFEQVTAVIQYRFGSIRRRKKRQTESMESHEIVEEETTKDFTDTGASSVETLINNLSTSLLGSSLSNLFGRPPTTQRSTLLDESLLSPHDGINAPDFFDLEYVLSTSFEVGVDGIRRPVFNSTAFKLPQDKPLLLTVRDREQLPVDVNPLMVPIYGSVVQIVINNVVAGHPFHLHGHTFWVMGQGQGTYDRTRDQLSIFGVKRDTVFAAESSWVVIRFIADNPGVWTLHCHIDLHNLAGMAVTIIESSAAIQNLLKLPDEVTRVCG